jgi:large subunit ribosomal protein L7/L12
MSTTTKLSVEELFEGIKNLTIREAADLVKKIETEFGISAAMPTVVAAAGAPAAGGAPAVEEKTEFTVILVNAGKDKIKVLKEVRTITGLGLKEAKDFVDEGNKPVKEGITKEEAESIKKKLEEVGAQIIVK